MLSSKYVAGFLDSDGCVTVKWKKPTQKPILSVSFSQRTDQDGVIAQLQELYGGLFEVRTQGGKNYSKLAINGKKARKLLDQVGKHLVVKRYYAQRCRESCEQPPGDIKAARNALKVARRQRSVPLPNFPPRKWLAGYLDGDGCFYSQIQRNGRKQAAQISLSVASSPYDTEGLEIIQKVFGGQVKVRKNTNQMHELILGLPPSKAQQMLGECAKHMVVKRDQAKFILGCARMGHYRDGKAIHDGLKHLKAHPHRLNDPGADIAAMLADIRDIPWVGPRKSA